MGKRHWIGVVGAASLAVLSASCASGGGGSPDGGGARADAPSSMDGGGLDARMGGDTSVPMPDAPIILRDAGPAVACTPADAAMVCGSLPCVDGFCCDQPCVGVCRSCALTGSEGTCSLLASGDDPAEECAPDAMTCGRTGTCDGSGGCGFRGAETSCDDAMDCTTRDVCDGAGACRGMAPSECGPGAGNVCCYGTCAGGTGCSTAPGACTDTCEANRLTIGQTCSGCGAAGGVGICGGGGAHVCDATSHVLCQQLACGGIPHWCTSEGGTWAWRPAARCDDGNACTYSDICGAGGSCAGTAVTCTSTTCAARACNGTSSCTETISAGAACDDANACTHGDVCGGTGACGGTAVTCTSTPCVTQSCNGTATCTVTPRMGACDDGNACTYGDTCGAGGACTGTTIDCASMSTTCRAFTCSGTATCSSMVLAGAACDDGDAMTMADMCQADGTCRGGTGCPPPVASCTNGAQSRSGCANAQIIGRTAAAAGTTKSGSTCSAGNDFNGACGGVPGGGRDHAYRIYMLAGERIAVEARTSSGCTMGSWNGVFRIFENAGCTDVGCTTQVHCRAAFSFHSTSYTAPRDGWVILVMDGQTIGGVPESGSYTLDVDLTCASPGCGC